MESLMFRALAFRQRESLETPQKPASLSPYNCQLSQTFYFTSSATQPHMHTSRN